MPRKFNETKIFTETPERLFIF